MVTPVTQGMKPLAVVHGVDGFSSVPDPPGSGPDVPGNTLAHAEHGGVGLVWPKGTGIGHGQAEHPAFNVHAVRLTRQGNAEQKLGCLREGQVLEDGVAVRIPHGKDRF